MSLEDTIVIEFNGDGAEVEHIASVTVDDVLNVDSAGESKSSFGSGEVVYLALHLSRNVTLTEVKLTNSAASIVFQSNVVRSLEEQWFFTGSKEGSETKFIASVIPNSVSLSYFGKTGSPSKTVQEIGVYEFKGEDFSTIPYIAKASIQYNVAIYKLTLPEVVLIEEDETYPVGVVFYVEAS